MKHLLLLALNLSVVLFLYAQEPQPAKKGAWYGTAINEKGAIPLSELENNLNDNQYRGKVTGTVTEVCQERGCWMRLQKADGDQMLVRFKDYGFFMPKDIVGKTVVLDGEATVKEISVKQLQHYAKDAGKSEEEIKKIQSPKRELQFVASGVLVL